MLPEPFGLLLVAALWTPAPLLPAPAPVFRFAKAALPPPAALTRGAAMRQIRHPVAKKATAAVAGALIGFFGGMYVGAHIGAMADTENSAMFGAITGAGVGAVAGGIAAAVWAR